MGFGRVFRSLPAPKLLRAVGSGQLGDVKDVFNFNDESTSELKAKAKLQDATAAAIKQGSSAVAEQERLKQLANESVRQQEEAARRRTIFGGGSIDEQNQRKTLLGL